MTQAPFPPYNGDPQSKAWAQAVQRTVSAQRTAVNNIANTLQSGASASDKSIQAAVAATKQIEPLRQQLPYFQLNSFFLDHITLTTATQTLFSITYDPPEWATSLTVSASWMLDMKNNSGGVATLASGAIFSSNPYTASYPWRPFLSDNFYAIPDPDTGWAQQTLSLAIRVDSTSLWTTYNQKVRFNAIGYFS